MSKAIHLHGSLVSALLGTVLALITHRPLKGWVVLQLSTLTPP